MIKSVKFMKNQRIWLLVYGVMYSLALVVVGAVGAVFAWSVLNA